MVQSDVCPDRVAIYIRWSTDDQSDGTTLEVQKEGCRHYVLSQGWLYTEDLLFVDDGYSGGNLDRPALNRLRKEIQKGRVDCVVVFKIDRLSRNVVDTVNLVLREWEGKCYVKSAREAIDTTTQQGKMFFYTLVSFAEWERSVIKERTWAGKVKRLQEGKNPGFRPPFGLQTGDTPGSFVIVEDEAAIVRRIFDLYNQGIGYKNIAVLLNREGTRFRGGREFSTRTVYEVLRNPIYVGQLVYGRVRRPQGGPQTKGAPTVVESAHVPAILCTEVFQLAQANRTQRAEQRTPTRAVNSDHLLTGLARCAKCGYTTHGRKRYPYSDGRKPQHAYYICGGQKLKGKQFCDAGRIRQEELDRWIVQKLLDRYGGEAGKEKYLQEAEATLDRQIARAGEALQRVHREVEALQRELEVIGRDYRREKLTIEEYTEHKAQIDRERSRLLTEQGDLERAVATLQERKALQQGRVGTIDKVSQWERLAHTERKHLLRELVRSLSFYRDPETQEIQYDLEWITDGDAAD